MSMKKHSGYTLIELMVMMAVVAIVLLIGVPQLSIYFQSNRMVSDTNDVVTAMRLARSEAIRRGTRVTVCKGDSANGCSTSVSRYWEQGWIVFAKATTAAANTANTYDDVNDTLLKVHGPIDGYIANGRGTPLGNTITPQQDAIKNYVSFTSRGVPKDIFGNYQMGVFSICDSRGMTNISGTVIARGVELTAAGNVQATQDASKIVKCP